MLADRWHRPLFAESVGEMTLEEEVLWQGWFLLKAREAPES